MGGAISLGHLLLTLAIVLLVFGTKKLRNIGGDLGGAIKNFKSAMGEADKEATAADENQKIEQKPTQAGTVIDVQAEKKDSQA
ncbi:MAG TPA: twin-arginine translocase TatA/TatE family subunit [Pseudomonadales bacterium]|nr:twin-arginine translocase TatA/TatE family subunit [Pseudomonadales bacterium]